MSEEYFVDNNQIIYMSDNPRLIRLYKRTMKKISLDEITREMLFYTLWKNDEGFEIVHNILLLRPFNLNTDIEPLLVDDSFVMAALIHRNRVSLKNALWLLNYGANITDDSWNYLIDKDNRLYVFVKEYSDLVVKYIKLGANPFAHNFSLFKHIDDHLMMRLLNFAQIKNYENIGNLISEKIKKKFIILAKEQAIPLLQGEYPYMIVCQIMDEAYFKGLSDIICNDIYKMAVKIGKIRNK